MPDSVARRPYSSFEHAVPRVQARALGGAVGLTAAAVGFLLTALSVLAAPHGFPIGLLGQFLYGYSETWTGAGVGALWGFGLGFAAGWTVAVVHNAAVDVWVALVRARADLTQKRNLLDHLR